MASCSSARISSSRCSKNRAGVCSSWRCSFGNVVDVTVFSKADCVHLFRRLVHALHCDLLKPSKQWGSRWRLERRQSGFFRHVLHMNVVDSMRQLRHLCQRRRFVSSLTSSSSPLLAEAPALRFIDEALFDAIFAVRDDVAGDESTIIP